MSEVVSTRLSAGERRLVKAAAAMEGVSVSSLLRKLILSGAREQLRAVDGHDSSDSAGLIGAAG